MLHKATTVSLWHISSQLAVNTFFALNLWCYFFLFCFGVLLATIFLHAFNCEMVKFFLILVVYTAAQEPGVSIVIFYAS